MLAFFAILTPALHMAFLLLAALLVASDGTAIPADAGFELLVEDELTRGRDLTVEGVKPWLIVSAPVTTRIICPLNCISCAHRISSLSARACPGA